MLSTLNRFDLTEKKESLLIGVFQNSDEVSSLTVNLNEQLNASLLQMLKTEEIQSQYKKVTSIHTLGTVGVKRVYFVGLGERAELTPKRLRNAFGRASKTINKEKHGSVIVDLESFAAGAVGEQEAARLVSEAAVMSTYAFADYKQSKKDRTSLTNVEILTETDVDGAITEGFAYGTGTNTARTLVNTPGNYLTPTKLAETAVDIAKTYGFEYDILEREDMERLGMGGLLAVSQGSDQPPKMIVVKYQAQDKWENVLGFVGKGLTFDAGGYSLKPAANMHEMKMDMGGSAAVLGAMETVGQLKPNVNVLFVIPSSENLINGSAMKPGDVLQTMSGKTVEVRNTDAEGRLILADGMTYARQLGANYLVNLCTLTGGVVTALGDISTGAMTNDDEFYHEVQKAADGAGEYIWQLPYFKEYRDLLKSSDVADLNNSCGRKAHPITGGAFVGEFAGDTPWVHLDIAGTAYLPRETDLGPKGATGVMVRTLANLVNRFEK